MRRALVTGLLAALLWACATRQPVLYPNATLEQVGADAARSEVEECQRLAAEFQPDGSAGAEVAKDTAVSAGAGAAAGAVGGAIGGSPGIGAAAGAASGATWALIRSAFRRRDPDPIRKRIVERCLEERGYEVVGWR
jgi:hypothetical protein